MTKKRYFNFLNILLSSSGQQNLTILCLYTNYTHLERRKLKFKIISQLIATGQLKYPLQYTKRLLREYIHEIGSIRSINHESTVALNKVLDQERFKLQFEKLTVDLVLVRNRMTKFSTIKNFVMN